MWGCGDDGQTDSTGTGGYRDRRTDGQTDGYWNEWVEGQTDRGTWGCGEDRRTSQGWTGMGMDRRTDRYGDVGMINGCGDRQTDTGVRG